VADQKTERNKPIMSIAFIVETKEFAGKFQTLVVPTKTDVLLFTRLSTGQRGRGQAWSSPKDLQFILEKPITSEPNGMIMTESDALMATVGNVTALSTRLSSAVEVPLASLEEALPQREVVADLIARLKAGDNSLNKYVRDNRRKFGIELKPITNAEPVVEVAPVMPIEPVMELESALIAISSTYSEPTNVVSMPVKSDKPVMEMASIPDKAWAERYLSRKIANRTDFEMLDIIKTNKQNLLIRGHAGSGKTMCVLAWASARDYRYYNISSNIGLEPSHLFGMWIPTEQAGVFKWQDGPVTDLVRNGGVLLLNEIDFMPERITTVLFGLLDDRREIQLLENGGEVIKAHPDLVVIGDHNPNYRGSRPMNQAWKDRFAHKWNFPYDKAIEKKLIKNDALLEVASKLRDQHEKGEIDTPISTRGLESFVKNVQNVDLDYAIDTYLNGFADDERDAVSLVFDTAKTGISNGFGIKTVTTLEADEVSN
jgi:hypothetical protein